MQTYAERMELIREAHKNFKSRNTGKNARKARISAAENEIYYTDGSQYAEQYYGDVYRATTRYDNDWD